MMAALLMLPLTGCATTTSVECPLLEKPPASEVDALEWAAHEDPNASNYVVALSKHYDKLAACKK